MPSERERFFDLQSFAVVGETKGKRSFPRLTYRNLRSLGKKVIPVDISGAEEVEGDRAHASLAELPEPVQGVIVEVHRSATRDVVEQVAESGIKDLWIHMGTHTPETLKVCENKGLRVRYGTCAVMYTQKGLSYHSIHKWLMKLLGKY